MSFLLLDVLPLKAGHTPDEARSYFDGLRDVFERHGLTRSDRPLTAVKTLRGTARADVVNLWETQDAEASMKGLQGDPEYQARVPDRDAMFDLETRDDHPDRARLRRRGPAPPRGATYRLPRAKAHSGPPPAAPVEMRPWKKRPGMQSPGRRPRRVKTG